MDSSVQEEEERESKVFEPHSPTSRKKNIIMCLWEANDENFVQEFFVRHKNHLPTT
jgi:hypothetical protein